MNRSRRIQTAAHSQSFAYDAAGRMTEATGSWGRSTYQYNAAGHRTAESLFTAANALQWTDTYTLASGRNHLSSITRAGVTTRLLAWDAAGNAVSDTRSGIAYAYGRDHLRRLASIAVGGQQRVSFAYDPGNLMVSRTRVNQTVNGATHFIHDLFGNVIAEAAPTGLTQREYIHLPEGLETPASPTAGRPLGQPGLSRPLAAFDGTGPAAHVLAIHTDQVLRPVLMTDATAAVAWRARFRPFGELVSVSGPKSLDARFPGQWFQFEAGLHANWHRNYDPTLGRYLEADPLGFPDGPNRYAYVGSSPLMYVDPEGLQFAEAAPPPSIPGGPWTWRANPADDRGGKWWNSLGHSCNWDTPDSHWDVDDGKGNRQRYDRWGNPLSAKQAHGYRGPRQNPVKNFGRGGGPVGPVLPQPPWRGGGGKGVTRMLNYY